MPNKKINKLFISSTSNTFALIKELCLQQDASYDAKKIQDEQEILTNASYHLCKQIDIYQKDIERISFLSMLITWAELMVEDSIYGEQRIKQMMELIQIGLLKITNEKKTNFLRDFHTAGHLEIIEFIRCYDQWSIQKREEVVQFYIEFSNWISKTTYGYIDQAEDMDRKLTIRRKFPFEAFIKLISELSLRERILAKLFYFGGERTLEEVLSIKIENIDFKMLQINYVSSSVKYPLHVFHDIIEYVNKRKNGYVFLGRTGEKMSYVVPYRCLKSVANKLNLDSTFTFKDLIRDI